MKTSCENSYNCDFDGGGHRESESGILYKRELLMASKCEKAHELRYNENNETKVDGVAERHRNKCRKRYCGCFCDYRKESESTGPFVLSNKRVKMFSSCVIVFALAVGIYLNSLRGDFVHDDVVAIVRNPDVNLARRMDTTSTSQFSSESGLWSFWKNDYWGMPMVSPLSHKSYRPITVLTFRLNYMMCGGTLCPEVFHGTNLIIHGLVSLLSFYLCWGVLRMKLCSSLFSSLLFALHPIHTEAVAGLTGRADALTCLMMLISFILYHKSLKELTREYHRQHYKEKCTSGDFELKEEVNVGRFDDAKHLEDGNHNLYLSSCMDISTQTERMVVAENLSECKLFSIDEDLRKENSPFSFPSTQKSSRSVHVFSKAYGLLLASGFMGFLSMLAKETGITVLGINLLYDLYIHIYFRSRKKEKRLLNENDHQQNESFISSYIGGVGQQNDATKQRKNQSSRTNLKYRAIMNLAVIVLSLSFRIILMEGTFPRFGRADNPAAYADSNLTRLLTFLYLPVFNIWLILYPMTLSYDWQMGSIPLVDTMWDKRNLASTSFYLTLLLFVWAIVRKCNEPIKNAPLASLLFITLPFIPASNLLFPVGFVIAERVLYVTSLGVCILVAFGLECLLSKSNKHLRNPKKSAQSAKSWAYVILNISTIACVCVLLVSFGLRTWRRNQVWQSRLSLFTSGIRDVPHNAKMHYNYANLQKDMGNPAVAIEHYSIALRLWPEYASAYNNLGTLLMGNPAAAEHQFLKAIEIGNQAHGGAHFNLGVLYMNDEKFSKAATYFKKCLIIDPFHQEAFHYYNLCVNMMVNNQTNRKKHDNEKEPSSDLSSKLNSKKNVVMKNESLNNSVRDSPDPQLLNISLTPTLSHTTSQHLQKHVIQRIPKPKPFQNSSLLENSFTTYHANSWTYFLWMAKTC